MANGRGTTASIVTAIVSVVLVAFGVFGYYVTGAAEDEARKVVAPVEATIEAVHADVEAKIVVVDDRVDINTTNIAVMTSRLDNVIVIIKEQNVRLDKIIDKL